MEPNYEIIGNKFSEFLRTVESVQSPQKEEMIYAWTRENMSKPVFVKTQIEAVIAQVKQMLATEQNEEERTKLTCFQSNMEEALDKLNSNPGILR
jgi:hypothetical protein